MRIQLAIISLLCGVVFTTQQVSAISHSIDNNTEQKITVPTNYVSKDVTVQFKKDNTISRDEIVEFFNLDSNTYNTECIVINALHEFINQYTKSKQENELQKLVKEIFCFSGSYDVISGILNRYKQELDIKEDSDQNNFIVIKQIAEDIIINTLLKTGNNLGRFFNLYDDMYNNKNSGITLMSSKYKINYKTVIVCLNSLLANLLFTQSDTANFSIVYDFIIKLQNNSNNETGHSYNKPICYFIQKIVPLLERCRIDDNAEKKLYSENLDKLLKIYPKGIPIDKINVYPISEQPLTVRQMIESSNTTREPITSDAFTMLSQLILGFIPPSFLREFAIPNKEIPDSFWNIFVEKEWFKNDDTILRFIYDLQEAFNASSNELAEMYKKCKPREVYYNKKKIGKYYPAQYDNIQRLLSHLRAILSNDGGTDKWPFLFPWTNKNNNDKNDVIVSIANAFIADTGVITNIIASSLLSMENSDRSGFHDYVQPLCVQEVEHYKNLINDLFNISNSSVELLKISFIAMINLKSRMNNNFFTFKYQYIDQNGKSETKDLATRALVSEENQIKFYVSSHHKKYDAKAESNKAKNTSNTVKKGINLVVDKLLKITEENENQRMFNFFVEVMLAVPNVISSTWFLAGVANAANITAVILDEQNKPTIELLLTSSMLKDIGLRFDNLQNFVTRENLQQNIQCILQQNVNNKNYAKNCISMQNIENNSNTIDHILVQDIVERDIIISDSSTKVMQKEEQIKNDKKKKDNKKVTQIKNTDKTIKIDNNKKHHRKKH